MPMLANTNFKHCLAGEKTKLTTGEDRATFYDLDSRLSCRLPGLEIGVELDD
jgi:hypothetical protein